MMLSWEPADTAPRWSHCIGNVCQLRCASAHVVAMAACQAIHVHHYLKWDTSVRQSRASRVWVEDCTVIETRSPINEVPLFLRKMWCVQKKKTTQQSSIPIRSSSRAPGSIQIHPHLYSVRVSSKLRCLKHLESTCWIQSRDKQLMSN